MKAYESIVEQYKEAMNSSFESADFSSIGTTLSTKMSDSILNTDTSAFSTAFAELGTKSGTDAATAFQAADYSGVGAAVEVESAVLLQMLIWHRLTVQ
ncbi:MAG: hypothetical protein ACLTDC_07355 [Lachnospiraceae bacterium]